jgi:hypothetical protein
MAKMGRREFVSNTAVQLFLFGVRLYWQDHDSAPGKYLSVAGGLMKIRSMSATLFHLGERQRRLFTAAEARAAC